MNELEERARRHFLEGIAEGGDHGGIHPLKDAIKTCDEQEVLGERKQEVQLFPCGRVLRDVTRHHHEATVLLWSNACRPAAEPAIWKRKRDLVGGLFARLRRAPKGCTRHLRLVFSQKIENHGTDGVLDREPLGGPVDVGDAVVTIEQEDRITAQRSNRLQRRRKLHP